MAQNGLKGLKLPKNGQILGLDHRCLGATEKGLDLDGRSKHTPDRIRYFLRLRITVLSSHPVAAGAARTVKTQEILSPSQALKALSQVYSNSCTRILQHVSQRVEWSPHDETVNIGAESFGFGKMIWCMVNQRCCHYK